MSHHQSLQPYFPDNRMTGPRSNAYQHHRGNIEHDSPRYPHRGQGSSYRLTSRDFSVRELGQYFDSLSDHEYADFRREYDPMIPYKGTSFEEQVRNFDEHYRTFLPVYQATFNIGRLNLHIIHDFLCVWLFTDERANQEARLIGQEKGPLRYRYGPRPDESRMNVEAGERAYRQYYGPAGQAGSDMVSGSGVIFDFSDDEGSDYEDYPGAYHPYPSPARQSQDLVLGERALGHHGGYHDEASSHRTARHDHHSRHMYGPPQSHRRNRGQGMYGWGYMGTMGAEEACRVQ